VVLDPVHGLGVLKVYCMPQDIYSSSSYHVHDLEKHSLKKFNACPFHWSLFMESSDEDAMGTTNMFIETTSSQSDDNDDG
jgi:hypothetical protein